VVENADSLILGTTGSVDDMTIRLPAAASNTGRELTIKKVDNGTKSVIVDGNGAETIDGSATKYLRSQYDSITIMCDGAGWQVIERVLKGKSVTTQTTTYTVLIDDDIVVCNSASAFTVNLPSAIGSGRVLTIKNINTGTITVDGSGSETIDSLTTQTLAQWESITISDCSNGCWYIV
jgi:anti-anti-sigma regulatory factor